MASSRKPVKDFNADDNEEKLEELRELIAKAGESLTHEAPEGFVKQIGDTSGQWVRLTPLQGVVLSAKLMDSNLDEAKSTALVLVEITKPCIVDADGEFRVAEPGDIVGIWYKPGMRALRWLCGQEVFIMENPKEMWKDTGKGNPMITFDIRAPKRGAPMQITDDTRDKSRPFLDGDKRVQGMHDLETPSRALATVPI